jgi:Fe-S cluster assembly scaffold protein SufB
MMRIETGDVNVASHRAAQYRLPGDQLFYLESRGLSPGEAVELLLRGRVDHLIGLSGVPAEAAETARSLAYALVKRSLTGGLTPRLEAPAPS